MGVFLRLYSWATDALNALNISSSRMDAEMNGMATGLSNCMTRDGQSPPTANVPMGGFKLTGLATATDPADAPRFDQIVPGEWWLETQSISWISSTSFKLTAGDATLRYTAGRRIKSTNTGVTVYSTVVSSVYGAPDTTITVVNDGTGALDVSMSALYYGQQFTNPSYLDPRTHVLLNNAAIDIVLASTALQKISFSTETVDSLSEYASGTFTAKYPGVYTAKLSIACTVISGAPAVTGWIYKNGVAFAGVQLNTALASGLGFTDKDLLLAAGDTVEFYAQRDATANSVNGRIDLTFASICRVL